MIIGRRTRWLLAGLAAVVVAGFTIYDFRDRLPSRYALADYALRACTALPKFGLDGRYQDYPSCPWDVSVEPERTYSGLLQPGEHGAYFLADDGTPKPTRGALRHWILDTPTWGIALDEEAHRSFTSVNGQPFNPIGPAYRVMLRGWRTSEPDRFSEGYATHSHILFVDEFVRVDLFGDELIRSEPSTR